MGNSMGNFKEYWDLVRKYPCYQGGFIWDFMDQAIRWPSHEGGTDMIFAYGGDFNGYDPSDGSFNCNGVINPDRVPNPHAYEIQYYYQNIWATLVDAKEGKFEFYNENFFRPLDYVKLAYEILVDGKPIAKSQDMPLSNVTIAPQGKSIIDIVAVKEAFNNAEYKGKEILVNFDFKLAKDEQKLAKSCSPIRYAAAFRIFSRSSGK